MRVVEKTGGAARKSARKGVKGLMYSSLVAAKSCYQSCGRINVSKITFLDECGLCRRIRVRHLPGTAQTCSLVVREGMEVNALRGGYIARVKQNKTWSEEARR